MKFLIFCVATFIAIELWIICGVLISIADKQGVSVASFNKSIGFNVMKEDSK
jgi:hypothetical protein